VSQSRGAPLRRGALAVVLVTASVAGYAGAAAFSALALPAVPVVSDFGPGDGLTRYVLTADEGVAPADLVQAVSLADGVVNAQPVGADRALVATEGLAPHHLEALPGVADAEYSPAVPVAAGTVADPYWPQYGWNLENTGTNAYNQAARADADDDAPPAGRSARARTSSSPSSTPATTPTTPTWPARCGPTRPSPAA
jgi:hypothetical protein